jgi:hypothetical protein
MADALPIVIVAVTVLAALIAVVTLASSGRSYDQIGHGGLSLNDGGDRPARGTGGSVSTGVVAARERDDEIRQLLEARNERRRRRGLAPVDVDAEMRALDRPVIDPGLEAEVRALVIARNERRARQGREPLDVDAEVARRLRELGVGGGA